MEAILIFVVHIILSIDPQNVQLATKLELLVEK